MPTKETTFSENARSSYWMFLDRYILPVLGDTLLTDVSPAMISKLLVDFQKAGYAHASTIKLYNILNGVFEMAFLDNSIPMNPLLKVKRPVPRKGEQAQEESEKALTVQELGQVLACLDQEPLKWRCYIAFMADTGCRRGEVCALQWPDIDFKAGTVTIRRNLQYTAARVYATSPKNGKIRMVDVGADVLSVSERLGHSDTAVTLRMYAHANEESIRRAGQTVRDALKAQNG